MLSPVFLDFYILRNGISITDENYSEKNTEIVSGVINNH
jgi:hypothetical protein